MRIAFVSRECHPLGGGGIGVQVAAACEALQSVADVTVVTSSSLRPRYEEMRRNRDPDLPPARFAFVEEPTVGEIGSYYSYLHLYSARVLEMLRELYRGRGPDLIEFADFLGEGLVSVQAKRGYERFLRDTTVAVRLHTSGEMCSVLDGRVDSSFESRLVATAERHALRFADRLVAPGGDVLGTYRRFYGEDRLAPATTIRPIVPPRPLGDQAQPRSSSEYVRFLYMGRLERRKGVQDLIRAFTRLVPENWLLTLLGGDTDTAPLGTSMREQLEYASAEHPQIVFLDGMTRADIPRVIDDNHVLVCPSRWECWPSVILEALERNRPALATPTGGMVEMLTEPDSGWLTPTPGAAGIGVAVERLLADGGKVEEVIASGAPRRAYDRLNDADAFRAAYLELAGTESSTATPFRRTRARMEHPLVSVVIPYFRMDAYIEDTVRSVFDQDYPRIEVIVVNDGSLRPQDIVLSELSARYPIRVLTQENSGLGRARNAGILQSRGRYVLPLDADNMLDPTFVSRCVEILEAERSVAFVTTWSRYVDDLGRSHGEGDSIGYQPIGNSADAVLENNVAGDGTAVLRRRIFDVGHRYSPDLTSYEDWQLYRELHEAGLLGRVIPERLLIYRVREGSMLREIGLQEHDLLYEEMQAQLRERQVRWESKNDWASTR